MTPHQAIDLSPAQASEFIDTEVGQADQALQVGDLDAALDGYVRALGLGLQLGPAPTEKALKAVLGAARQTAKRGDARGLAKMGPSVIDLVHQIDEADALPSTGIMEAWATVAADVGSLIGQVGLVLALPADHRAGLLAITQTHAALLDEATGNILALTTWIDDLQAPPST